MALIVHPTFGSSPARGLLDGRFGKTIAVELPSCPEVLTLEQDWQNGALLGGVAWHSGYVLAEILLQVHLRVIQAADSLRRPSGPDDCGLFHLSSETLAELDVRRLHVLEIGAGAAGLPSMIASALGASRVVATDTGPVLRMLRRNVARNQAAVKSISSQFGRLADALEKLKAGTLDVKGTAPTSSEGIGTDSELPVSGVAARTTRSSPLKPPRLPDVRDLDWAEATPRFIAKLFSGASDDPPASGDSPAADGREDSIGAKASSGTTTVGRATECSAGHVEVTPAQTAKLIPKRLPTEGAAGGGGGEELEAGCIDAAAATPPSSAVPPTVEVDAAGALKTDDESAAIPVAAQGVDVLLAADVIYAIEAQGALLRCIESAAARVVVVGFKPRHGDREQWVLDRGIPGLGYRLEKKWMVRNDAAFEGLLKGPVALADATELGVAVFRRVVEQGRVSAGQ